MSSSTDLTRPEAGSQALPGLRMPELKTVEATHASARAQGYAVGWAQGRREAEAAVRAETEQLFTATAASEARREAEHAAAVAALREAAVAAGRAMAEACHRVDDQASILALELTRELVGTLGVDPVHLLDRVIGLLPQHEVVSVHLNPAVAVIAGDLRDQGIAVVADPTLGVGDAIAHTADHVVDLRVAEAVARLAEVLR